VSAPENRKRGDRLLGLKLAGLVAAMFAFGFALVPLYDVFCDITGFGGKTSRIAALAPSDEPVADADRTVRVEFLASVPSGSPWSFSPSVTHVNVHPGELFQAHYEARNLTGQALVAQAVPSVAPGTAAKYFRKFECFCFTQQAFAPNEVRDLTVSFVLDPSLPDHIDTVSLSYTFFAVSE
jgi:cytochrome c oxidase assembly protein subunit 11